MSRGVGHDDMNDKIICVIRNVISREPIGCCTKIRLWGLVHTVFQFYFVRSLK